MLDLIEMDINHLKMFNELFLYVAQVEQGETFSNIFIIKEIRIFSFVIKISDIFPFLLTIAGLISTRKNEKKFSQGETEKKTRHAMLVRHSYRQE